MPSANGGGELGFRRIWLLIAATALLTSTCAGEGAEVSTSTTTSSVPEPSTTSTTTTITTTTITTTTAVLSPVWSRVPDDESVFGGEGFQWMQSVIAGGPGLVAVGSIGPVGSFGGDAAVWTSSDGISWLRVPHDEAVFGGGDFQEMVSVTVGGPGLVAVGMGRSSFDAAVWTSPDGISWSRVPDGEDVLKGEGDQQIRRVTAGGPGLVAVGVDFSGGDGDAAVWTSPDGISWSRVPHDEAVFGGEGFQAMSGVVVGGPGLVAVGSDLTGDDDGAVWTSPDGISWSRVPHDEGVFGGEGDQWMRRLTAGGPGLVAVGVDTWAAAVWTSSDGISWSRVPHDESVFGGEGNQAMVSVTVGGPGLVAVGLERVGGNADAAVWTSPDGISWSRVPHYESVFGGERNMEMFSVTVGGPGLVAVGLDRLGSEFDAAVWVTAGEDR